MRLRKEMPGDIKINTGRLLDCFNRLAQIGKDPQTERITRPAFSQAYMLAVKFLEDLIKESGLDYRVDPCGNIYATLEGKTNKPFVLCGSHIDSVPEASIYDTSLSIAIMIECLRGIKEAGIKPDCSIIAASFVDEEGRFEGLLGSRIVTGEITLERIKNCYDHEGLSAYEAMKSAGYSPENISDCYIPRENIKAFLEIHIDNGYELATRNLPLGIVEKFAAPAMIRLTLIGRQAHAGATPMQIRQDPLMAACELAIFMEELAKRTSPSAVVTVGYLNAYPGVRNVIPDRVDMHFDIRDYDKFARDEMITSLINKIHKLCRTRRLGFEIQQMYTLEPVACSKKVIGIIEEEFGKAGIQSFKLTSGAIYDSAVFAKYVDAGEILIRTISSPETEYKDVVRPEDIELGARIFANTLLAISRL